MNSVEFFQPSVKSLSGVLCIFLVDVHVHIKKKKLWQGKHLPLAFVCEF